MYAILDKGVHAYNSHQGQMIGVAVLVWHGIVRYEPCDHTCGSRYAGEVPCTGPKVCVRCGAVTEPTRDVRPTLCDWDELRARGYLTRWHPVR